MKKIIYRKLAKDCLKFFLLTILTISTIIWVLQAVNFLDFVIEDEKDMMKPGALIIDVSCDQGMGFYFATPTTFKEPILKIEQIDYYAVDHTPSYFWESASRSISAALIVHLPAVIAGKKSWQNNATISNAINILDGIVVKEAILRFQNREKEYPHLIV